MSRPIRTIALALAALAVAGLVAACGSFDSKSSGEHLIRDYINKFGKGQVKLTSVSCPSGVPQKSGTAYSCKVTLHNIPTGQPLSGTITVHIVNGNKVEIEGSRDVHLS